MLRNLFVVPGRVRMAFLVTAVLITIPASQVMANNGLLIDIKPGSDVNPINCKSKGVIPVAILSTASLDATTVDPTTLSFAGAYVAHIPGCHVEDVQGDGDPDLVCHFRTQDADILADDVEACVTGETYDGIPLSDCDLVTPKHCPN